MRDGWSKRSLGDVATIYNGNSINAEEKKKRYLGQMQGLPFIATKDVGNDGVIDYENGVRIPNFKDFKVAYPNSVFVCAEGGSAGKKVAFIEREVCFGNKLFALQPKKHLLEGRYLYYFVQSQAFKENFRQLITGIIGGVSSKKFKEIPIILSPLPEQQRVVEILDQEFAKIDALKANVEKSLQSAKDLYTSIQTSVLENKTWDRYSLNDVCRLITDGTHRTPKYQDSGIPFLSVKNITGGFLDMNDTKHISEAEHQELIKRCKPEFNDILYSKVGTTGVAKVIDTYEEFSIFVSLALLKVKQDIVSSSMLERILNAPYVREQAKKLTRGTANKNFVISDIKKVLLYIPTKNKQEQIEQELDTYLERVLLMQENNLKTLALCDDLKQSLLRKAFNGEL